MTKSTDGEPEPEATATVASTVEAHDVRVEKLADNHREEAVKVTMTIDSSREDRCDIKLVDPLPAAVRDQAVEFHPDADLTGWSHEDGAIVYQAGLAPGATVTMEYGVRTDHPTELDPFAAEPALEVTAIDDIFDYWSDDEPSATNDPEDAPVATPDTASMDPHEYEPSDDEASNADGSVVERLVAELHRSDPSEDERATIREGFGLNGGPDFDRLEALREEVDALRAAFEGSGQPTGDGNRLESELASLSADIEARLDALSADLAALQDTVDRGARWRSTVHEAIMVDIEDE